MNDTRKKALWILLAAVVAVIILTWGSVGSAILALGLLLSGLVIALKRAMDRQDEDYFGEDEP